MNSRHPANRLRTALAVAFALVALAREAPAQVGAFRQVVALDRDGRKHSGALKELRDGNLAIGGANAAKLALGNLVWLKFVDRKPLGRADDPQVLLTGGGRLALKIESIDDTALVGNWVRFPHFPAARIPLEIARGAILARPPEAAPDARLWNRVSEHREPNDLALLVNGDSVSGEFVSLDDRRLMLKGSSGPVELDRTGVLALAFNPQLMSDELPAGPQALVSLVDGSRFRAAGLRLSALDRLEFQPAFGGKMEVLLGAVESLRFLGGCASYLSQIEPEAYKFEPFLGLDWPWRADRSVQGGPLSLRGIACATGLGVHSQSELSYRLDGNFRWFKATVGVDDDTAGKGSVAFEVLVDDKSAFKSEVLSGTSPPVEIDKVNVAGAKRLTLRVEYATQGDILDHADWCDAVLVR
jgi:hypothetical protein